MKRRMRLFLFFPQPDAEYLKPFCCAINTGSSVRFDFHIVCYSCKSPSSTSLLHDNDVQDGIHSKEVSRNEVEYIIEVKEYDTAMGKSSTLETITRKVSTTTTFITQNIQ